MTVQQDGLDRFVDDQHWWLAVAGPGVWMTFGAITVPFVAGVVDTRLVTPLAAPGYVLMVGLTVVGSHVAPEYAFWLYWIPFFLCSYLLSIVVAAVARRTWPR